MLYLFQQVLNGVHAGALYALLAFGYALVNGVLHRTNLAYGALFAFCGQTMILFALFGWDRLWLIMPLSAVLGAGMALFYGGLVSRILARNVLGPLERASPNGIVVATLGLALVLMELARVSAETRDLWLPPLLAYPVVFAAGLGFTATLTVIQIANCAVVLAVVTSAGLFLARSRFGRQWHALRDDPLAAALCGVDAKAVFSRTVVLGGLVAALSGVLAALHYGNISYGTGLIFGLKVLFITAAGSYDRPERAALGAFGFGLAEALWSSYFPLEWRDAWMFAGLAAALALTRGGWEETPERPG